jgi:carboxyl-terminal processing protease
MRYFFLLLCLVSCGVAFRGTGDRNKDVFEETLAYLERDYYGFALEKVPNLGTMFRPQLEAACSSNPCPAELVENNINTMIGFLSDDHTYYQNPQTVAEPPDYARFGMFVRYFPDQSYVWVSSLEPNSVAVAAGIRRGDRIVAVDGQPFAAYPNQTPRQVLRAAGKIQREIGLTIERQNSKLEFRLTGERKPVAKPSLTVLGQAGILKIPSFSPTGTAQAVHDLVLQAQAQKLELLVLDLRDNLGGRVTETVLTQIAFVERGGFIQEEKNSSREVAYLGLCAGANNLPLERTACWRGGLVVLVNSFSASGAEYVAQRLQDEKRAQVIGEQTYGVGNTITSSFDLQNGGKITVSKARARRVLDRQYYPAFVTPNRVLLEHPERLQRGEDDLLNAALGQKVVARVGWLETNKPALWQLK